MFGYERCPKCTLYYLTQDFNENICIECSPTTRERKTPVPLSKVQYKKLYEKRLSVVKSILKPTLPAFPSDVFD
jgi:uncharacterized protein (DUF2225 family)